VRTGIKDFDFESPSFFLPEGMSAEKSARPLPTSSSFMARSFRSACFHPLSRSHATHTLAGHAYPPTALYLQRTSCIEIRRGQTRRSAGAHALARGASEFSA
jgi:hypothetical protein